MCTIELCLVAEFGFASADASDEEKMGQREEGQASFSFLFSALLWWQLTSFFSVRLDHLMAKGWFIVETMSANIECVAVAFLWKNRSNCPSIEKRERANQVRSKYAHQENSDSQSMRRVREQNKNRQKEESEYSNSCIGMGKSNSSSKDQTKKTILSTSFHLSLSLSLSLSLAFSIISSLSC